MSANSIFVIAICIGIVAGLRAVTAPAAISWAAYLGWLNLHGSPLSFMGSIIAVVLFSLGAIGEFINDKLPKTPNRTAPPQLIARIVMGALSGACVCASAGQSLIVGALLGAIGALIGTFGGFQVRAQLTSSLKTLGIFVAILEDLVAIAFAYFLVSRG